MANTTASASGMNRNFAMPASRNIGTNTMQIDSVETSAGRAIWWAPSRIAVFHVLALLEVVVDVLDGDGGIVHQDTHRERQPAQGHDVDGLAQRGQAGDRGENRQGMEMVMMRVLRQLPRNSRINRPVSAPAITASRITPEMAARTNTD
jgi:hypothetical protein